MAKIQDETNWFFKGKEEAEGKEQIVFETNYFKDKNERVRIPAHERKKVFRYMHPLGAVLARIVEVDRDRQEAKGFCAIKLNYNDENAIATEEAYCGAEELAGTGIEQIHYPEIAETQSISRALTTLGIPLFLDELEGVEVLKKLDQTNEFVIERINELDSNIHTGKIHINNQMQINIDSEIREATGFNKGDKMNLEYKADRLIITKGNEKKIQTNYRLILGKKVVEEGLRMGTFPYTAKEGELCILKNNK